MDTLWEKALPLLKSEITEQAYNSWLVPIHQSSYDDDHLVLAVPNKFFEDWIRDNYEGIIKNAIVNIIGKTPEISFVIDNTISSAKPSPSGTEEEKAIDFTEASKKNDAMGWLKNVFSGSRPPTENNYHKSGLSQKYTFDNFVVGQNNRFAHAAAVAISENPAKTYNPFFIHGGVGLGKTHLLKAIGHHFISLYPKSRVLYISSEEFTNQLISAIRTRTTASFRNTYRGVDLLLIDDIQFISGKDSTQEEFFNTFNKLYDSHKQIVISSDRSPKEIPKLEERLVSRFDWGLRADIQPPDYETRVAIFEKKCENESVHIPREVLSFLAENIKTNIREMEGALIRVVAYATLSSLDLTVDVAREVLKDMLFEEERKISLDQIQEAVSSYYNTSVSELKSRKRTQNVAYPRQVAMYISRKLTDHSLPEIGESFGGRDHTTVIHALDKIKKAIDKDKKTKSLIDSLIVRIKK